MAQDNRVAPLIIVLILGILVQAILIPAEKSSAPYRTAIDFAKAYYYLDPGMAQLMCDEGVVEGDDGDINLVDAYLYAKRVEAGSRGFDITRLRRALYNIHTDTEINEDGSATVHISGTVRTIINPVFGWVGKIFFITTPSKVSETLTLINENGKWKVCGTPFNMGAAV